MARRRKAEPATPQARDLALAIRQGERRNLSQKEIAATLGINERTVRKIKSGETTGTRTYKRLTTQPKRPGATRNAFNAEFIVGYDASGAPVLASSNIIIPDIVTRTGERRAPTALDVFRIRTNLEAVAAAERAALARRYDVATVAGTDSAVRLRRISNMRKPASAIIRTGA
jgi:hypothetical protein